MPKSSTVQIILTIENLYMLLLFWTLCPSQQLFSRTKTILIKYIVLQQAQLRQFTGIVQFLFSTMFGVHRNQPCYKGTILQRNYRKMTMKWSFSYNSFVKFCGQIIWSHNMTGLYPYHGSYILRRLTVFTNTVFGVHRKGIKL